MTVRIGASRGNARGGWKQDVMFDVAEGYDVFRAKCITKFNTLASSAERSGNESQDKCMRMSAVNFVESLHLFLYVANAAPAATSADFYRATEKRVQQARLQRLAHEAASAVSFGPITAHYLDMVNARRPDSATFHVPDDDTT
ncbi:hypothetical protein GN244_ATG16701 [Phytophthora infestans]|uniref:Uncharacterized protein n=1 Tax=Phytophthora infestans TaxID=4787 RepID=A0A833SSQ4_PHYIN|nr:hypothetical protein GN244_ATG16701 [Phytophthora infestans]KAF4135131.1 hypothetical protein GN958_ATG15691 [Phytophthora infestans]